MACSKPDINACSPYVDFQLDLPRLSKFYNQKVTASNWHLFVTNSSWMDFLGCQIDPKYSATYNCFTDIYMLSSACNEPKRICDSICEGYGNSVENELQDCKGGYQEHVNFMLQAESICKQYSSPTNCLSAVNSDIKLTSATDGNMMDKLDPQYSNSYVVYGTIFGLLVVGGLILMAFKLHRKTEEIVLTNRESRMSFSSLAFSTFERPIFGRYFEDREDIALEEVQEADGNENPFEDRGKSIDSRPSFQSIPLDDDEPTRPLVDSVVPVESDAEIIQPFSDTIRYKSDRPNSLGYPSYPTTTIENETQSTFDHSYTAGLDYKGNQNELSFQKGDKILFIQMQENGTGEAINVRTYQKGLASIDLMTLDSVKEADAQINPFRNPTLTQEEIFRSHTTLLRSFLLKNVGLGTPEISEPKATEQGEIKPQFHLSVSPLRSSTVNEMFKNPVDDIGTGETLLNKSFE
ncbi:hypothetical protein HDV06_006947 [Boothiomyces sp. JEL0866]|nr:hypothetical protein HDV06_006947 [Boothiomyces sp. JEL0866]